MNRPNLFSRRNKVKTEKLYAHVPPEFRQRFVRHLNDFAVSPHGSPGYMLNELSEILTKEYGQLDYPAYEAARVSDNPVIQHFAICDLEKALDFIEAIFWCDNYTAGNEGVALINDLMNEHSMAFMLTDFKLASDIPVFMTRAASANFISSYPMIVNITDKREYVEIIQPTLAILRDPRFKVCDEELRESLICQRNGNFGESITKSCAAFESFMKTILSISNIEFDKNRDTCSKLVGIMIENGKISEVYRGHLESIGTIRNKIGSAHGRGPEQLFTPGKIHSEHMINIVCSCMLILHQACNP
jgi:hypothetical protein